MLHRNSHTHIYTDSHIHTHTHTQNIYLHIQYVFGVVGLEKNNCYGGLDLHMAEKP